MSIIRNKTEIYDQEKSEQDFFSDIDQEPDEFINVQDEYENFDEICDLRKTILNYVKENNLSICENLSIDNFWKFFN